MHKIRVGVIRGGPSNEYEVSLKTGATVLGNLSTEKYSPRDILIDRKGIWYMNGISVLPHEALTHIDVAFNSLHGHYGEDGKIQHIFEVHKIPFIGSGSFASAIGMNKSFTKEVYRREKIKTPQSRLIEALADVSKEAHKIFQAFPLPVIVKPSSSGSSMGITIVKDFRDFDKAVSEAFKHSSSVLVEEFIKGKEASCGVIEGYRDQEYYTLPPIETCLEEIVPGNFSSLEKREIELLAIRAHKALGLRHYSRSDFIVHPKRGVFILETNTVPGLADESLFPKALKSVGATMSHFLDHVIGLAISGK